RGISRTEWTIPRTFRQTKSKELSHEGCNYYWRRISGSICGLASAPLGYRGFGIVRTYRWPNPLRAARAVFPQLGRSRLWRPRNFHRYAADRDWHRGSGCARNASWHAYQRQAVAQGSTADLPVPHPNENQ